VSAALQTPPAGGMDEPPKCPSHPRITLRQMQDLGDDGVWHPLDLWWCRRCGTARPLTWAKDGVRVGFPVDPGPGDDCERCRVGGEKCAVCGTPTCWGHTAYMPNPRARMCRTCYARVAPAAHVGSRPVTRVAPA
jgi:hypothetical protein